jgi:ribonuclease P protein component
LGTDLDSSGVIRYTFSKEERLTSKVLLNALFETGKRFTAYPVRLFWVPTSLKSFYPVQVVFGVGKSRFPRAVDRNQIKRWMRESWRHRKHILYRFLNEQEQSLAVMIVYSSSEFPGQAGIDRAMDVALETLIRKIQKERSPESDDQGSE